MRPTPKPIRIVHVVFSLDPGGMENGLVNMARALSREEFEVHVCCLERRGSFAERLPDPRNVYVLDKGDAFSIGAILKLVRLISRLRPHVLHSHNLGPLIYSGLASGMGLRCPIFHGEHSLLPPEDCRPKRLRQRQWLYRSCRKVHTVSSGLRRQLLELGLPGPKITVLPNGVDTDNFAPGCPATARNHIGNLPPNAFVLGIVGRFGPFKRHALLIDAFDRLALHQPAAHLLVVGSGGPEEGRVRQRVQASPVARRIHFAGFQDNPRPYYQAMDLLVVPSVNEGMANAVLEAMACGVPVLANSICGNSEMITHGTDGFVAELDTTGKLHAQLEQIVAEAPRLRTIGAAARRTAVERFSLMNMVRYYARLYRELAGHGQPTA